MEQVHGVDVSWMTQASPKGELLSCHGYYCATGSFESHIVANAYLRLRQGQQEASIAAYHTTSFFAAESNEPPADIG